MIKIPFEIQIHEALNPDGPDAIHREIMKAVIQEEKPNLNTMVMEAVNEAYKKKIELLKEPALLKEALDKEGISIEEFFDEKG